MEENSEEGNFAIVVKKSLLESSDNNEFLSKNPNAIDYLEQYPEKIDWYELSGNPNAIPLIKSELTTNPNSNKISWSVLCSNPNAIDLIIENKLNPPDDLFFYSYGNKLCSNPNALELMINNFPEKINWNRSYIYQNPNPKLMDIIKNPPKKFFGLFNKNKIKINYRYIVEYVKIPGSYDFIKKHKKSYHISEEDYYFYISSHPDIEAINETIHYLKNKKIKNTRQTDYDKFILNNLCSNPNLDENAFTFLEENLEKITNIIWYELAENKNPVAIRLIQNNLNLLKDKKYKYFWTVFSQNPKAIDILKENPTWIDNETLLANPSIFSDYLYIDDINIEMNMNPLLTGGSKTKKRQRLVRRTRRRRRHKMKNLVL